MRFIHPRLLLGLIALLWAHPASAHLSYLGRDFGVFVSGSASGKTISTQSVESVSGWADGTDADYALSHYQTYFRFTLQGTVTITISVTANDAAHLFPAFSIYSGLGKTSPPDYDEDGSITADYLASLGGVPKEGAFRALTTWKMGNDNSNPNGSDFSTFTYVGHAADGTAANYGSAAGINGDGVKDGFVTATFTLGPGNYTLVIGGANYFDQVDSNFYGFSATVSAAVPEPDSSLLTLTSLAGLACVRRRGGIVGSSKSATTRLEKCFLKR